MMSPTNCSQEKAPSQIILNLHAHRHAALRQAGREFLSLLRPRLLPATDIFCGDHLLCARLRSSNIDSSAGSPEELQRVVAQIRMRQPKTRIILRGNELADPA
jgi:Transposase DDE domain group 1